MVTSGQIEPYQIRGWNYKEISISIHLYFCCLNNSLSAYFTFVIRKKKKAILKRQLSGYSVLRKYNKAVNPLAYYHVNYDSFAEISLRGNEVSFHSTLYFIVNECHALIFRFMKMEFIKATVSELNL